MLIGYFDARFVLSNVVIAKINYFDRSFNSVIISLT